MLSNPRYANAFSFIPVCTPNRKEHIIDEDDNEDNDVEQSDMVQILLNLAYLPDKSAELFEFKPGFTNDFREKAADLKKEFEDRLNSGMSLH